MVFDIQIARFMALSASDFHRGFGHEMEFSGEFQFRVCIIPTGNWNARNYPNGGITRWILALLFGQWMEVFFPPHYFVKYKATKVSQGWGEPFVLVVDLTWLGSWWLISEKTARPRLLACYSGSRSQEGAFCTVHGDSTAIWGEISWFTAVTVSKSRGFGTFEAAARESQNAVVTAPGSFSNAKRFLDRVTQNCFAPCSKSAQRFSQTSFCGQNSVYKTKSATLIYSWPGQRTDTVTKRKGVTLATDTMDFSLQHWNWKKEQCRKPLCAFSCDRQVRETWNCVAYCVLQKSFMNCAKKHHS